MSTNALIRAIQHSAAILRILSRDSDSDDELSPEGLADAFWDLLGDSLSTEAARVLLSAMPAMALPWESLGDTHVRHSPGRVLELAYVGRMSDGRYIVAVSGRIVRTCGSLGSGKRHADHCLRRAGVQLIEGAVSC